MEHSGQGQTPSDAELLARLARGCERSWPEFYRRYQGRVYRFALQMSGSRAIAEEAVQETFLALMEGARKYDAGRGEVAPFVFGIARNKVLRGLDGERKYAPMEDGLDAMSESTLDSSIVRRQEAERVRLAVLALPASYREAVVLCDLQELDYRQAAGAIGCAIGTVRSRLHRGRQLLGEKLNAIAERNKCRS